MRKRVTIVLALLALCAASVALAAYPPKSHEATGTVKSIDAKTRAVVVDTGSASETFTLEASATIEQSSPHKALTLADLKPGQRVQLHYAMNGPTRTVSRLEVLPDRMASNADKQQQKPKSK